MLVTDLTVRSLVSAAGTTHGGAISSAHRCRTMIVRAKQSQDTVQRLSRVDKRGWRFDIHNREDSLCT